MVLRHLCSLSRRTKLQWSVKLQIYNADRQSLGSFAIAVGVTYFTLPEEARVSPPLSIKRVLFPLTALPVGVGEESLCRGYLQSVFSELFTPWGGIAASSLIFGALHIPNAWGLEPEERRGYYTFSVPFITLLGVFDGWLTYKNHSLKESVALHTWYDFILFTLGSIAGEAAITGRADFALAIPF